MNDSVDFDDDDFEDDEDEFDHFVAAQDTVYDTVVAELTAGKKQTHWMWFIFPVLTGIGESPMAMFYSLRDTAEAQAYLGHPLLGERLLECMRLIRSPSWATPTPINCVPARPCSRRPPQPPPSLPLFWTRCSAVSAARNHSAFCARPRLTICSDKRL